MKKYTNLPSLQDADSKSNWKQQLVFLKQWATHVRVNALREVIVQISNSFFQVSWRPAVANGLLQNEIQRQKSKRNSTKRSNSRTTNKSRYTLHHYLAIKKSEMHTPYLKVQVNKPGEWILVHRLNIGQVRDTEEQYGRVYCDRLVAITCLVYFFLRCRGDFLKINLDQVK